MKNINYNKVIIFYIILFFCYNNIFSQDTTINKSIKVNNSFIQKNYSFSVYPTFQYTNPVISSSINAGINGNIEFSKNFNTNLRFEHVFYNFIKYYKYNDFYSFDFSLSLLYKETIGETLIDENSNDTIFRKCQKKIYSRIGFLSMGIPSMLSVGNNDSVFVNSNLNGYYVGYSLGKRNKKKYSTIVFDGIIIPHINFTDLNENRIQQVSLIFGARVSLEFKYYLSDRLGLFFKEEVGMLLGRVSDYKSYRNGFITFSLGLSFEGKWNNS